MITDQFVSRTELKDILSLLDYINILYAQTKTVKSISINGLFDDDGLGRTFTVYDTNGEILGHIGFGEEDFVFYFDDDYTI